MKNHATRLLIVTAIIVFFSGGGSGCATRSKVTPTASDRITKKPDLGFDWYLGNYLATGANIQASVVIPTATGPLATDCASDVGFDWYLGDMMIGGVHTPANNIGINPNADEVLK